MEELLEAIKVSSADLEEKNDNKSGIVTKITSTVTPDFGLEVAFLDLVRAVVEKN